MTFNLIICTVQLLKCTGYSNLLQQKCVQTLTVLLFKWYTEFLLQATSCLTPHARVLWTWAVIWVFAFINSALLSRHIPERVIPGALVCVYLCFSSFLSGVWSSVRLRTFPFLHIRARLSPTLPTTSSIPSRNSATVAVVPTIMREAGPHA